MVLLALVFVFLFASSSLADSASNFDDVQVVNTQPVVYISALSRGRLNFTVDVPNLKDRFFVIDFQPFDPKRNVTTPQSPCEVQVVPESKKTYGDTFTRTEFYTTTDEIALKCRDVYGDPVITVSDEHRYDSFGDSQTVIRTCGTLYVSAVGSLKPWNIDDRFSVVSHQFQFCTLVSRTMRVVAAFSTLPNVDTRLVFAKIQRTEGQKTQYLQLQVATKLAIRPGTKDNFLSDPVQFDFKSQDIPELHLVDDKKTPPCDLSDPSFCVQIWDFVSEPKAAGPASFSGQYKFEFQDVFEDDKPIFLKDKPRIMIDLDLEVTSEIQGGVTQLGLSIGFFKDPLRKHYQTYFRKGERVFVSLFVATASEADLSRFQLEITNVWICSPSAAYPYYSPTWNPAQGSFGCKQSSLYIPTSNLAQLIVGDSNYNFGKGVPSASLASKFDVQLDDACKSPFKSCLEAGFSFLAKPLASSTTNYYFLHVEVTLNEKGTGRRLSSVYMLNSRRLEASGDQISMGGPGIAYIQLDSSSEDGTQSLSTSEGANANSNELMVVGVSAGVAAACVVVAVAAVLITKKKAAAAAAAAAAPST